MISERLAMLRHVLNFKREQWQDPESLEQMQQRKLEKILQSARKTRHYQDIITASSGLSEMPMTEKDMIRSDPGSFLSVSRRSLIAKETSGSTGKPLSVFMDRYAIIYRNALLLAIAYEFGLTPLDVIAHLRSHSISAPRPPPRFSLYRPLLIPMFYDEEKMLHLIRKHRANIIGWYPSAVSILAAHAKENPLRLKAAFCSGELLTEGCRELIQGSFSCPVFNQYACWEFGPLAFECPEEHSMHVISGSAILEVVDSKGKPKKSGTGGIVVTGLHNHAMPLLRYRIDDIGSWGRECPCGRGYPVLESLEGRSDDLIVLPSGRLRSAFSVNVAHIEGVVSGAWAYQVVQEKEDLFVFRYAPTKKLSEADRQEIASIIKRGCLGEPVKVEFEEDDSIKKGKTGKLRRVISRCRGKIR